MKYSQQSIKCELYVGNEIVCDTEVLKSNLCDYNYRYILARSNITIIRHQAT